MTSRRAMRPLGRLPLALLVVAVTAVAGTGIAVAATPDAPAVQAAPASQFTVTNGTIRTAKGSPVQPSGTEAALWGNASSATTTIQGSGRVMVGAIGSPCGGPPIVGVVADGRSLGTVTVVSAANYDSYRIGSAATGGLPAGTHTVTISLTNDFADATCDRNAFIGWARMENAAATTFVHPGIDVSQTQLDDIKARITARQEPWYSAFTSMTRSRYAALTWTPKPVDIVKCASSGKQDYIAAHIAEHPEWAVQGCEAQTDDAIAAETHALMYYFTGNAAHAQKSIQIMNAWSQRLTAIWFDQYRIPETGEQIFNQGKLQAAWTGETITRAGEIIRYTYTPAAGATTFDVTGFSRMLTNVLLPLTIDGWTGGGANWMASMADATIKIGVFTDSAPTYHNGIADWRDQTPSAYYLTTDVPTQPQLAGSPFPAPGTNRDKPSITAQSMKEYWNSATRYVDGLGQETCRDLSHTSMALEATAFGAETARIQGVDLFGEQQTRLTKTLEYNASLTTALDAAAPNPANPPNSVCPKALASGGNAYHQGWELGYRAYAVRLGIALPETRAVISRIRPTTTGLHLDWQTLLYGAAL